MRTKRKYIKKNEGRNLTKGKVIVQHSNVRAAKWSDE
jgi:hypothetical protein